MSNIGNTDKPMPTPAEIAKRNFLNQSAIDKFSYLYDAAQRQGGEIIESPIYIGDKIYNMGTQVFENLGELNANQSQFAVSGRAYVGHNEIVTENYVAQKNKNGKFYIENLIVTDMDELLALNDVDDSTFIGPFFAGQRAFVEEDGEEMIFTGSEWLKITYHVDI